MGTLVALVGGALLAVDAQHDSQVRSPPRVSEVSRRCNSVSSENLRLLKGVLCLSFSWEIFIVNNVTSTGWLDPDLWITAELHKP